MTQERPNAHFERSMALNRDHNSTKRPQREQKGAKFGAGKGEKRATFWAVRRRGVRQRGGPGKEVLWRDVQGPSHIGLKRSWAKQVWPKQVWIV